MRKTSLVMLFATFLLFLPAVFAQGRDPIVILQTTKGPIVIRVFLNMVPYTSRNFLDLVNRGFYNGLNFHRVENWCIQGGDPNGNGSGDFIDPGTGRPRFLRLEINPSLRHNSAGVVAMARQANNPNSASCQFYITKAPMPGLNGQYAIFGGVIDGLGTVQRIQRGDRIISAGIAEQDDSPSQQSPQRGGSGSQRGGTSGQNNNDSGF